MRKCVDCWIFIKRSLVLDVRLSSIVCLALFIGFKPAIVVASSATEYQIKAAYLYHFTRLVDWPSTAFNGTDSFFRFCVLGKDPFDEQLKPMGKRRTYNGLPIRLSYPQSALEARDCHLLYLSITDTSRAAAILRQLKNKPILTVSSHLGFISRGGIIGFVTVNKRIRLEINRAAARRAGIDLSAKLLEVAISVKDEPE